MEEKMKEKLEFAITIGSPSDLIQPEGIDFIKPDKPFSDYKMDMAEGMEIEKLEPEFIRSESPRGLSLKSIEVTSTRKKWWKKLKKYQEIYFLTVAFDFSGKEPEIYPPDEISTQHNIYKIKQNGNISCTLGDGVLLFQPRIIEGGLVVYVIVVESNQGIQHVGKVMSKVHEDLKSEDSLFVILKDYIDHPTTKLISDFVSAATKALQPIATILKENQDDHLALINGYFSAKGSWQGKLKQTINGISIELNELP